MDLFAYKMMGLDTNLAAHAFVGMSSLNTSQSRYYLGGFESVRGLPDGYMQGTRAAYGSLEARQIVFRAHRLWIQTVAFTDVGMARDPGDVPQYGPRSAAGVGVRFSVPQINRMMFRFDYAWSLDGSGQKGLTAGMGQFFDPFPPL
jgi:outer membrane protein assembly factor BamA